MAIKLLTYIIILLFLGCDRCQEDVAPIDQLPPATQDGKETFGCLVNGQAFVPKGTNLGGPILSAYYQYIQDPNHTGFFFNVGAGRDELGRSRGVSIGTNNLLLKEGATYKLTNYYNMNEAFGHYGIYTGGIINEYFTQDIYQGELYLSRFDDVNQVVSGTFWFDAVNDKGEKVEVREGRFDVHFVK